MRAAAARGCWPQAARGQAERLARLLRAEGQARYGVGQGADSLGVVEMGGIVRLCIRKNKLV